MALTLEDMARKGRDKLAAKIPEMVEDYKAAIDLAIEGYKALPFGPRTKAKYEKGMRTYAAPHYEAKVKPEIADKWYRKWLAAVSR